MSSSYDETIINTLWIFNNRHNTYKKTFERACEQLAEFGMRLRENSQHTHARHYHTFCMQVVTGFAVCNSTNKRARVCAKYVVQFIMEASTHINSGEYAHAAQFIDEALVYAKKGKESYAG